MNVNALKFFNNKGNQLNFQYTDGIWNGKMLYDNNGSDTYKVQSIYIMEETDELSDSDVGVITFQYFPTGYNYVRSKTSNIVGNVTDIKKVNSNSSFYTKWVYVDLNIKNNYKVGDRIFFEGGSGDFEKYNNNELSTFTILALRSNSILIESDTSNDIFTDLTSLTGITIETINCLELEDTNEIWNDTDFNTVLIPFQPIILNNTINNDGIYYIDELVEYRTIFGSFLDPTYTAVTDDIVKVTVNLFSDRVLLYDGSMSINAVDNTILFNDGIPNSLVVGYELAIQENITSVNVNNLQFLTITSIDKNTNTITVSASGSLFTETINAFLYLSTNKIILYQPVLKLPNGQYDINYTLNILALNLNNKLQAYNLISNTLNNTLNITQTLASKNTYFSIEADVINNGSISYSIPVNSNDKYIFILKTTDDLNNGELVEKQSALNYFEIKINDVDSYGFDILLNGEVYHVDKYTDVTTTINTWYNDYLTLFEKRGINITTSSDGIFFETMFPNVPFNIDVKFGQLSNYNILYEEYSFDVYSDLSINIDGVDYLATFDTDTDTTINSWVNTYKYKLLEIGIVVSYTSPNLIFGTLSNKLSPVIKINAGYDFSKYINSFSYSSLRGKNINSTITSNRILSVNGVNFENRKYYSGQTLIVSGLVETIANGAYNIISVNPTEIFLSYQGPLWDAPGGITINAGKGLRKPTRGLQSDPLGRLRCTWEDTIKDEIFFFDFSGSQLVSSPALQPIMSYTGITPLCGPNNEYEVILNKEPNLDPTKKDLPYYQQTIFNELYFELNGYDEPLSILEYPEPIQIHTGYNSPNEGVHNSTMSIYFEEDITNTINTDINLGDDIVQFIASDNSINLISSTLSFVNMGYKPDQIIKIKSTDNTGDSKSRLVSVNAGKEFKIVSVTALKMILIGDTIIDELSIQELPVISPPFYTNGVMNVANRSMSIEITVQPKLIMKVQMWGQTESEDERHKINLNRLGRNIYGSDLDILQDYDSDEKGIDWVLLNNKRKQLLISGNEIFDYIGSYKSIKNAINYWEWTSLNLQEYFINVNTKSPDYGKLHTIDVIGLFDGTKPDHTKSKLPLRLPNANYKKTNKFSLLYSITDDDGTIISGLTVNEVYAKLYKLKNWLVEKVVPVGTNLRDVSFKLKSKDVNTNVVSTISSQWLNSKSTHDAIQFDVTGYTIPVNANAGNYSISITPKSINTNFHYEIKVKTFGLELFNSTRTYIVGEYVFNNGKVWIADRISIGIEPSSINNTGQWIIATSWTMPVVQIFQEQRFDSLPVIFTINKNLDPNFEVTITSYGDYGLSWVETKNYTLNYGPWL